MAFNIHTQLKNFLPPKVSEFLIQNQESYNQNATYKSLGDIHPIQGAASIPEDISENMKQFWIEDLKYVDIHSRVSEFHSTVRTHPDLFEEILSFSETLFSRNYFLHCYFYLKLYIMNQKPESEEVYRALWGLLSSHALLFMDAKQKSEPVLESDGKPLIVYEVETLNSQLDSAPFLSEWMKVKHRLWLMHYAIALFRWDLVIPITNRALGQTVHAGIFSICVASQGDKWQDRSEGVSYLPILQMGGTHLIPYILMATIVQNKRIHPIVKLIECVYLNPEANTVNSSIHPVIRFAQCLYLTYDFDGALAALEETKAQLSKDIFAVSYIDTFLTNAKSLVASAYANVHSVMKLDSFIAKFGVAKEDLGQIIPGQFDVVDNEIQMKHSQENVYQILLQKGEEIAARQQMKNEKYYGDKYYGDKSYGDKHYGEKKHYKNYNYQQ